MIRGAIDLLTPDRIGGWIYSDMVDLRNRTILAFIDGACIGAGQVDSFRQDLADAGLGDGMVGFSFNISPQKPEDVARVAVRLEGSDASLIHGDSQIVPRQTAAGPQAAAAPARRSKAQLDWMLAKDWLTQSEHIFLSTLADAGVAERSLRQTAGSTRMIDPVTESKSIFEIMALQPARIAERAYADAAALAEDAAALTQALFEPVIAIWSTQKGAVAVVEGGHASFDPDEPLAGAIDYACGPDRLLFLDLRCPFGPGRAGPASDLKVFFVERSALAQ